MYVKRNTKRLERCTVDAGTVMENELRLRSHKCCSLQIEITIIWFKGSIVS